MLRPERFATAFVVLWMVFVCRRHKPAAMEWVHILLTASVRQPCQRTLEDGAGVPGRLGKIESLMSELCRQRDFIGS